MTTDKINPPKDGFAVANHSQRIGAKVAGVAGILAVVLVVFVVMQQARYLVPQSAPRRAGEAEPGGKPAWIPKRKVEAHNDPLTAIDRSRPHVAEHPLGRMAGRRIAEIFPIRPQPANPDAVAPGLRLVCRAPIDDHECIEHR